ncbi:2-oxoacid dehydrogenases acyltransferase (catalytic domain) [Anaerocolumna xylanovorans DSM 12503]|uniref:2-oxoacid dehydrogenases acyltransferase (Catalytic domain) n=2 Tax=Anaerocolumna TaxID=1843210 RepID=A0A1M7Y6Z2_9FIRM|nr:2-oxoacid dehydrogenases acyltransferase (catalytic domain) [Anaerocolumna xylanovorans DSM 12503]
MRKRVIASVTQEGWKKIPHVSYVYEADVTKVYEEFKKLKASGRYRGNITFNTLLLRVIVEGIKSAMQLNAEVRYSSFLISGQMTVKDKININMPVLLPDGGMVTVNLRDMGNKSLGDMAEQIESIKEKVGSCDMEASLLKVGLKDTLRNLQRGKLGKVIGRGLGIVTGHRRSAAGTPKKKQGIILSREVLDQGTITVSNLGAAVKGTRGRVALLDIIPPQVCAIGIGVLQEEPGVYLTEDKMTRIGIRKVIPFTIAFDHRALDFGEVAPFINRLEEVFNNTEIIRTW